MAASKIEVQGKCPECGEPVVCSSIVELPEVEVFKEVLVPTIMEPPIKADWLKPSWEVKYYEVTTTDLVQWLQIQFDLLAQKIEDPEKQINPTVVGVSLILSDTNSYRSSREFTELLVGISGAVPNTIKYNWVEKAVMAASNETHLRTPLKPLLKRYMFNTNNLGAYLKEGDYQKRIKLQKKLGIGDEAMKRLINSARPDIVEMSGNAGPLILVGLDVKRLMQSLFATKTQPVILKDASGNTILDKDGNPRYKYLTDDEGKVVLDVNEKPVIAEEPIAPVGEIQLEKVTPLNEFEVQYTIGYRISEHSQADRDEKYAKEYVRRISRGRKR